MADMTRIKGRIAETIYPNGTGAITAESHQALLLEMVDTINREKADQSELVATQESLEALTDTVNNLPQGGGDVKADGVYPDLTAGDLAGRGESVPAEFGFRASGGKSIKDGRAYIKRIKGNSVVWNNMVDTRGYEGEFIIRDGVTIIAGHKYLLVREKADGYLHLIPVVDGTENYDMILLQGEYAKMYTSQYTDTTDARVYGTTNMGGCIVSDLTHMFGAGNEPSTIEEFNARVATLGIDMYAYNEGQVIHCNTESIKSVGDNAWDEQWEVGGFSADGEPTSAANRIRSRNYIEVLANEEYYANKYLTIFFYDDEMRFLSYIDMNTSTFTTPSGCRYIKFYLYGTEDYNHDILISLCHSDTDAGYQPYWQDTLPLPIIRKYFPDGMKKAGTAHDEIRYNKASGKWEKVEAIGIRAYQEGDADNAAYLTDGKVTCYPLAEPIVTELDEADQNFRDYYNVADFGTEQSQSNVPSAAFSADIIYQFNAVDMIREHELEITELQQMVSAMQAQLTSLINGGQ